VGDRKTNKNLRYKIGKSLNYNEKEVFAMRNPEDFFLPKMKSLNYNEKEVFAMRNPDDFFAYPNNFSYYANYYKDTFQHGGISLEEMMIPYISLKVK